MIQNVVCLIQRGGSNGVIVCLMQRGVSDPGRRMPYTKRWERRGIHRRPGVVGAMIPDNSKGNWWILMDGLVGMHRVVVSVSVHLHKSWLIWLCVEKYKWYGLWIVVVLYVLEIAWLICIYGKCGEHELTCLVIEVWVVEYYVWTWVVVLHWCGENNCVCESLCWYIIICNDIIILFLTLLLWFNALWGIAD